MKKYLLLLVVPAMLGAQTEPVGGKLDSSISGVVLAAGSGAPIPDATVYVNRGSGKEISVKADSQGHYELRGLPAGNLRVTAQMAFEGRPFGPYASRLVAIAGGQALTQIDFHLKVYGKISGRILDENKEPMPGISVLLIAREYSLGVVRYVYTGTSMTNDLGEYTMARVEAGRGFLVMAQKRRMKLLAIADTPADQKFRRKVPVTTWFPGSTSMQGAQPITLRPGEMREGVDIQMGRAQSYCMDGILAANGRPGVLSFTVSDASPTSGASGDGAMFMTSPYGVTADDGKFRICELHPGSYTLTAYPQPKGGDAPGFFGSRLVTITDEDVHDLTVSPQARLTVPGEVVIEGTPPEKPVDAKFSFTMSPMTRAPFGGEFKALGVKSDIPGSFAMEGVLVDEYSIRFQQTPPGFYIRDITYGGRSVLYQPVRVGSETGDAGVRVSLAQDGGYVGARVQDSKGNPMADAWVCVMPDHIASEAVLAAAFLSGQTDQTGMWKSAALAPGKYFVLALDGPVNKSPEDIGKLWQARTHAEEVQVTASGTVSANLTVRALQ